MSEKGNEKLLPRPQEGKVVRLRRQVFNRVGDEIKPLLPRLKSPDKPKKRHVGLRQAQALAKTGAYFLFGRMHRVCAVTHRHRGIGLGVPQTRIDAIENTRYAIFPLHKYLTYPL